jgi:hypothetical protein
VSLPSNGGRSQDVCRRNPGHLSKAKGAYLVVDHFLRSSRLIKKKKKRGGQLTWGVWWQDPQTKDFGEILAGLPRALRFFGFVDFD